MTDHYSQMNSDGSDQKYPSPHLELAPPPLGLAGRMAQTFIHSPLSLLFFLSMLFMGLIGLIFTPRQEDPQISVPMVDIFVQYPGASAKQVERLAIEPLQRIMSEIPDVEHVYSMSTRGQGLVTVQFEVGEQLEHSIFKVHDKLQSNMDKIPPGVAQPLVKPKGIDDVPVVNLTLWSNDLDDGTLRTLALDVMQSVKEVPNTGQSFVVGGRAEQVRVEVEPQKLSGFELSLAQVANTIQTANSEKNTGYVEMGDTHFSVFTGSFLRNADDIASLVVGTYREAPVYVRDVATVTQGPEETQQIVNYFSGTAYQYEQLQEKPGFLDKLLMAAKLKAHPAYFAKERVDGAAAVTIAVAKKINTNGVTVAKAILRHVESLKGRIIPNNVHVEVTRDYGQTANDKVWDLIMKLFIATGLVAVLVLTTLGLRPAVVVTLVVPVVIMITVFSAWILGYTIDRVSLFALIFSIGILVDDAIVVIENIYRRWLLHGETDTVTAVDAVREVGNPTILATFTVVAALLPMGFVSGMMGPYMEPIPALGSVAMIFSLLAAFMFTPWWAMRMRPSIEALQKSSEKEHRYNEKLEGLFRKVLPPLINSRFLGYLFLFTLIGGFFAACSMFYFQAVEVKMLPLDNKPEFNVFVDMPEGTALPVTANITYQLIERLRDPNDFSEVTALQSYIGTSQPFDFNGMVRHYYLRSQPWQADIHVQLKQKSDRHRSSHEIAIAARLALQDIVQKSGLSAKLTVVEMPPGPPVLQSVVAEVYGPDEATRREVATKLTEVFAQAKTLDDVDNYMAQPYKVWHYQVDGEKSVRRGISVDMINQNLAMALGNFKLGDIKRESGLEPTYIVIQVPLEIRAQLSRLYDLPIADQMGNVVPLAELGHFVDIFQEPILYQKDLRPIEYVVGDTVGTLDEQANRYRLGAPIYGMLEVEKLLQNYKTPDGVELKSYYIAPPPADGHSAFEWTGEWTVTYETFRDMGLAFGAAMVLIYILVVWEFGNFIVPAVIMVPIPLTLLGIIPGHYIMGAAFTATSMIGWIALAGIIVRNSILLVDYSIHEIQHGTDIKDAVILACKTRTRPILITAFALAAGSLVIIFDPIFQGMAISLLFGVMVSTLLTLVVIPLGCISVGVERLCASGIEGSEGCVPLPTENIVLRKADSPPPPPKTPLWFRIYTALIMTVFWLINAVKFLINTAKIIFYIIRAPFLLLSSLLASPPKREPPPVEKVDTPAPATVSGESEKHPESVETLKTEAAERFAPPSEVTPKAPEAEPISKPTEENPPLEDSSPTPVEKKNGEKTKKLSAKKLVPRRGIRLKPDIKPEDIPNNGSNGDEAEETQTDKKPKN